MEQEGSMHNRWTVTQSSAEGGGVANGPEQAGLGAGWGGRKGEEAAFSTCPGSLGDGRWAVGMVPGPGMRCPGH